VSKSDIEAKLKVIITAASDSGQLDIINWDHLELPARIIQQERAQAKAAQAAPFWQQAQTDLQTGDVETASVSKKRKSVEMDGNDNNSSLPPWRATNPRALEDRITRRQPLQEDKLSKSQQRLEKRQKKFANNSYTPSYARSPSPEPTLGPVVGTCQTLEKKYFRLTSAPIPAMVRPESILRQTLDLLKKKWKKDGNYNYINDQLKSMRQDLCVQHIKNDFTVTVYEIHARIALEKADMGEYNQCQTQLRALYARNLGGNPVEFKAYRILYFIHTSNRAGMSDLLAELTTADKEELPIKHALKVRSALATGNYHQFFRLYLDTPNMGAYLMDMFVVRERLVALCSICRVYKPDVPIRFITEELGFESDGDAAQFILDRNGEHLLEEKENGLRVLTGKAGQLFEALKTEAFRKIDIKGQI
jgi:hypothetical protein